MNRDEQRIKTLQEKREVFEQRVSDFKHSFESPSGKRVYAFLSEFCFENKTTFDARAQSICNWNEGSRAVILKIKEWLKDETVEIALSEELNEMKLRSKL